MRMIVVSVLATLVTLSGCSLGADVVAQRAGGSVLVVLAKKPDAYLLAIVRGSLTRTDTGCLGLLQNGTVTALVAPYGSVLADDGQSVELPRVGVVRIGDEFQYGGGTGEVAGLSGVPDECRFGTDVVIME